MTNNPGKSEADSRSSVRRCKCSAAAVVLAILEMREIARPAQASRRRRQNPLGHLNRTTTRFRFNPISNLAIAARDAVAKARSLVTRLAHWGRQLATSNNNE